MKRQKGALLSICSNSFLVIMKLIAGLLIGSVSIISESIHSGIDLLASLIAYFSIKEASKDKDDDHPYGHGKYENLSGLIEALLILLAGVMIIVEAGKKVFAQHEITDVNIGIIVMCIGSLVNLFISINLFRIAKREQSLALEADAHHLLTDVYTSGGVMLGLVVVKITKMPIFDIISAILVALLIIKTSVSLIKKSTVDLVDTSLETCDNEKIISIIKTFSEVKDYHKMRTRRSGNSIEIDIHIKMDKDMTLEEVHDVCHDIEDSIKEEFKNCYVVLHPEPFGVKGKSKRD